MTQEHSIIEEVLYFLAFMGVLSVFFFFLEKAKPVHKKNDVFDTTFKNEMLLALFNVAITSPLLKIAVSFATITFLTPFIPFQIFQTQIEALPLVVQILIGMLIIDFSVYWRHRFSHYGLWSFHSIHHSALELRWTTKLRLHPGDITAAVVFDTIILHIFGFDGDAILYALAIATAIDFFVHTNINVKYPKPLRYLLASPHSHRWHHANQKEAYDKNFCSVFPFYDLMFGTFYHPEDLPSAYGLSKSEDKNFHHERFSNWLSYPFIREYKRLTKNKKQP